MSEDDRGSGWRKPATVMALAALVLSVMVNIGQMRSASEADRRAERELALREAQWERALAEQARADAAREECRVAKDSLQAEYAAAEMDLKVWNDAIFKDNAELLLIRGRVGQMEASGNNIQAEWERKNITLMENTIATKEGERQQVQNTLASLRQLLGTCSETGA